GFFGLGLVELLGRERAFDLDDRLVAPGCGVGQFLARLGDLLEVLAIVGGLPAGGRVLRDRGAGLGHFIFELLQFLCVICAPLIHLFLVLVAGGLDRLLLLGAE